MLKGGVNPHVDADQVGVLAPGRPGPQHARQRSLARLLDPQESGAGSDCPQCLAGPARKLAEHGGWLDGAGTRELGRWFGQSATGGKHVRGLQRGGGEHDSGVGTQGPADQGGSVKAGEMQLPVARTPEQRRNFGLRIAETGKGRLGNGRKRKLAGQPVAQGERLPELLRHVWSERRIVEGRGGDEGGQAVNRATDVILGHGIEALGVVEPGQQPGPVLPREQE